MYHIEEKDKKMKLNQLKNIIKEELRKLRTKRSLNENIAGGGCKGTCTVTVNERTYSGKCKTVSVGLFHKCQCLAGPHTIDCGRGIQLGPGAAEVPSNIEPPKPI
jgi:hypothetical protein